MRVFVQGSDTTQPFTDVYKNAYIVYEPDIVSTGKADIQYSLSSSRDVQQGTATWTTLNSDGTMSSTMTLVMPELGAVRLVNYASSGYLDIQNWRSIVSTAS